MDISKEEDITGDQARMASYLLGELGDEEQLRMERDFFSSDIAYQNLLIAEDELTYAYVENRLSPESRARFERTIGATERGQKNIAFARSLLQALRSSQIPAAAPSFYRAAAFAAAVVLGLLSAWLAFRVTTLGRELQQLQADRARSQALDKLRGTTARPAEPVEASFLLTPGRSRSSGGPARLEISPSAELIRLELVAPPGAATGDYVVTISTLSGEQVWSQSAALSGRFWIVKPSTKLFPSGAFEATVRKLVPGEQPPDLATYSFRVLRK